MNPTHCIAAVLLLLAAAAAGNDTPGEPTDLIGTPLRHVTRWNDTLLDLARRYDVGYVELLIANPGVDPWLPGDGRTLAIPTQHLLPRGPRRGIMINLPELRLYFFARGDAPAQSFPVSIGDEGKETPQGTTTIVGKRILPAWVPTASERAETPTLPAIVPPGPDNPMGMYALYLGWRAFAIHGTNKPYSIGRRGSHGCIRMYPEDIRMLFKQVSVGTPVAVVNQPFKLGWHAGEMYLEVHPDVDDINAIEAGEPPRHPPRSPTEEYIRQAAGAQAGRIDWDLVRSVIHRRDGMPVRVTRLPDEGTS
jgi:L,D-transpeptidase ErfK/SrfK